MNGSVVPYIPDTAPFTLEQRAWLNGYLAGLFARTASDHHDARPAESPTPSASSTITILYGSQTGTAEGVAKEAMEHAKAAGLQSTVCDLADYDVARLPAAERLLLVCSTYGDGNMPDNVRPFWEQLCHNTAPRLDNTRFSVLALGDTNYETFCQAGKNFDTRLEALGAARLYPRMDCDVDYEEAFATWIRGVLSVLCDQHGTASERVPMTNASLTATPTPVVYSRKHPFPARMLKNMPLTAPHSSKETRHYELALEDSGMAYSVGDALGVIPSNCPELVEEILAALGCQGEEAVPGADGNTVPLSQALLQHYDITVPSKALVAFFAERSADRKLQNLLQPDKKQALETYLWGRESIDFLLTFPQVQPTPIEFVGLLKKLQHRAYSISSSPKVHPDEVHLTVASVRYTSHGRSRQGVCSTFLAERVGNGSHIPVFLLPNKNFTVPQDHTVPMIMVGPGTGVAPFRAFLEERRALGATGKNWLFFGERKRSTDFFYQDQLLAYQQDGFLTRLDVAFSRDQQEKLYVQHRMLEHSKELYTWLEEGGYVFVCGEMHRMAKDVDAALHRGIQQASGCSSDNAFAYLAQLKQDKRYVRDVY
jgi:sulfite reductase (NADPH) flavoprotein alpha-component